ncbi:MAG: sigma-70 family RNA polymerase sigma factor [Planctomycetes bacterium]|nr:sigma-70 family RNA polymerase sigma factor [Planctomycetota bacterium]
MSGSRISIVLRRAAQLFNRPGLGSDDAALLDRINRERDPAAFEELLARHGPMIWGLCKRLVHSEADAEDVFQATFLVLVRDANRVKKAASVGSWLYGVATRIGRKARARSDRQPDPNRLRPPPDTPEAGTQLSWNEVRSALDEELSTLSEHLLAPILLCYFDGKTQDEAAVELGWNPRTVKARIARGRELLRVRLTRRGIELPAVFAVPLLDSTLATAVPPRLLSLTVVATANLVRGLPLGSNISQGVTSLSQPKAATSPLVRVGAAFASVMALAATGYLLGRSADPTSPSNPPPTIPAKNEPPVIAKNAPVPSPGVVRIGPKHFRPTNAWNKKIYFTGDGKYIVAPNPRGTIELWNPETGELVHEITIPNANFHHYDYSTRNDRLAIFGIAFPTDPLKTGEATVWVVDVRARKIARTIREFEWGNRYNVVARFTPDGKHLAIGTHEEIHIWDIENDKAVARRKQEHGVDAFAVSPDGKTIAFGRYDVYLWKWQSDEAPKKFASFGGFGTELVTFSPDGKTLYISGIADNILTSFEVETGRETGAVNLGATPDSLQFSPDGQTLAATHRESTRHTPPNYSVVLWDLTTGKERDRFSVGRMTATDATWSPDGSRLAATTDSRLWVWDTKTKLPLGPSTPGHEGGVTALEFGPDGRLFTASYDRTIRSWDSASGKSGLELVHDYQVRGIAISPDGSLVAGSALHNDLRVWDAKTGMEKFRLVGNGRMGGKRKVRFTPDGRRLVAWGDGLYTRVWDTRNGKLIAEHRTWPDGFTEADLKEDGAAAQIMMVTLMGDLSGDGSTLALSSYKSVKIFDVETGRERLKFEADPNGIGCISLSPDGKRLAVAGRAKRTETKLPDGTMRHTHASEHAVTVWDLSTTKSCWHAKSPGSWPEGGEIVFSPDGRWIAEAVTHEKTKHAVLVWEAEKGTDMGRIDLQHRGHYVAFDRAGKRLAVSHDDTTATLHDLETALKPTPPK